MSGLILVGTASWTDPTLIKARTFYPKGCSSAEARLRFYATRFPMVEVNSSYYALPSVANSTLWAERTPAEFRFNVKAFRLFTGHQTPLEAIPLQLREELAGRATKAGTVYYKDVPPSARDALWSIFIEALQPLKDAGKLNAVHFQFAPWLMFSSAAFDHIDECRQRLPGYLISAEFRHMSWFAEQHLARTLEFERSRELVHVIVDGPQGFRNSVPPIWESTNPTLVVVRLHGRNAETWNAPGNQVASDRFNYDYSDIELQGLAVRIKDVAATAVTTMVVFNNNYGDQGQRNATTLMEILRLRASETGGHELQA